MRYSLNRSASSNYIKSQERCLTQYHSENKMGKNLNFANQCRSTGVAISRMNVQSDGTE